MPQPNLNSADYYEILGLSRNANDAALKKAYRKLAVKWHPDKNPDNEQATTNFQKISEAYAALSDPAKRQLYDQAGKQGADAADQMFNGAAAAGAAGAAAATGGFGFGGFPPGGGGQFQGRTMSPEDAQKFFSEFFGSSDPFAPSGGASGGASGGVFQMGGIMPKGMGGASGVTFSGGGIDAMPGLMSMFGGGGGIDPISAMFSGGKGGADPVSAMLGGGGMGPVGGIPDGFATSSSHHQRQAPPQRYDVIRKGTVVSLHGLINAPERNGSRGFVNEFNTQTERYLINLVADKDASEEEKAVKTISVKALNMLQHIQVEIYDIQNMAELNGKSGTILARYLTKELYNVYVVPLKRSVCLKPENIILRNGTVAAIYGLQNKPELNGTFGTIIDWTKATNKYDVQLSPQQVVRIKAENMRV